MLNVNPMIRLFGLCNLNPKTNGREKWEPGESEGGYSGCYSYNLVRTSGRHRRGGEHREEKSGPSLAFPPLGQQPKQRHHYRPAVFLPKTSCSWSRQFLIPNSVLSRLIDVSALVSFIGKPIFLDARLCDFTGFL